MKEDSKKIKEIMRDLSKEATWVGEDGDAVCVAKTENAAWKKFKNLVQECIGEYEAKMIKEEYELGGASLFLFTEQESREHDDAEWYASTSKHSPHGAWMLQPK